MPQNIIELDEGTKDHLLSLLDREPAALSVGELEFLAARRHYLTPEEQTRYGINEIAAPRATKKDKKEEETE